MKKFPVKKIESDSLPVTNIQVYDRTILLQFKSGKIYKFDDSSYKDSVNSIFNQTGKFFVETPERSILRKANSIIEKNENQYRSVVKLSSVLIKLKRPDEKWFDAFKPMWDDIIADTVMISNDAERDTVYPILADSIIGAMSLPYTETMTRLNKLDERHVQIAETGFEDFPLAYFYTKSDIRNNCEIWYKAIDPIILFGKPVDKFV